MTMEVVGMSSVRSFAKGLDVLGGLLAGEPTMAELCAAVDDCIWMVDALLVDGDHEDLQLDEMRRVLSTWKDGLSNSSDRSAAHERTIVWSARLTWVAALLEATR